MKKPLNGITGIYWRLRIFWLALRWIPQFNLGDEVRHNGMTWTLLQGVCNPCWGLWYAKTRMQKNHVHEKDMQKVMTPRNMWRSFTAGYRFYMTSWFDIWCREGIKPWMRGCRIWPGR